MFSNVERSSAETLLPATNSAGCSDRIASWRLGTQSRPHGGLSHQTRLLIGAVVSLCTLTGLLTWATTSVGPAPRVAVTLASTDYRNNLNLPINGFGDRAVGRLAAWATEGIEGARRHVQLAAPPIELTTASDFARIVTDPSAAVSLTFISAHGISTPNGAALLSADAINANDAVPVLELIHQIACYPASQKKVLMLDCVHFISQPSMGVVLNDFARQMRDLDDEIKAIPNFVVLLSSDVNQQSWINPADGTTAWAAAITSALNGDANDTENDGWVDVADVHQSAAESTQRWVSHVCGLSQMPLLLPLGEVGVERSVDITLFPNNALPVSLPSYSSPLRANLLSDWWEQHQALASRELHPSIVSPIAWQHFEVQLRRFEQFELAGCRDAADSCLEKLEAVAAMLNQSSLFESIACRAGLVGPEVVGFNASADKNETAKQLGNLLLTMPTIEATDHWLTVTASQSHAEDVAFLRRTIIDQQTRRISDAFRTQGEMNRQRLKQVAELVNFISDPLQPVSQTGLILQLLARDLPAEPIHSQDAHRFARWLELCLRADRVSNQSPWWSSQSMTIVDDKIKIADRNRRLAGDLLTSDSTSRPRADQYLTLAESAYADVDRIASTIIAAGKVVTQGQYRLGRVRDLLAAKADWNVDKSDQAKAKKVNHLYRSLDEVERLMDRMHLTSVKQQVPILVQLSHSTIRFEEQLASLEQSVNEWQAGELDGNADRLPDGLAALTVVGGAMEDRVATWTRLCRLSSSTVNDVCLPTETIHAENLISQTKNAAMVRGTLALSAWPNEFFDELSGDHIETQAQLLHRLEVFASENQWWRSLAKVGDEIGQREFATRNISNSEPSQTNDACGLMLRFASNQPLEANRKFIEQRQNQVADFLAWQAQRVFEDGYWSLDDDGTAYYLRACELLMRDYDALRSPNHSTPKASSFKEEFAVEIGGPDEWIWTTQLKDQFAIHIRSHKDGHEGFATIWVDCEGRLRTTHPLPNERFCRPLVADTSIQHSVNTSNADAMLVTLERTESTSEASTELDVYGYFRGRRLHKTIPVRIANEADVQIANRPLPLGGRVAVRESNHTSSGSGAAITLVLDCSGSMGANRGEAFGPDTKYAQAISAVETLLDALPSGTKLSIWSFGQAVGPNKTVQPAERTIRQIQAPLTWEANDLELREQVINAISYPVLEPWNESPLMATMVAAAGDLRSHDGIKTMVAITDGSDNRVGDDTATNPLGLSPEQLIKKHFDGTGITLNVIAFRVEQGDVSNTQRQLKTVETLLPAGRFIQVEQTNELANALRGMLIVTPEISFQSADTTTNGDVRTTTCYASPAGAPAGWTPHLDAGLYRATTDKAVAPVLVEIGNGDQLVLNRSSSGLLSLWPSMEQDYRWCPQRQAGRWRLALEPIVISTHDTLHRKLVLWTDSSAGTLAVQKPVDLWIEAKQSDKPLVVRWQTSLDKPRSSFDLEVKCPSNLLPEFKVWISDREASPIGTIKRDQDFYHLDDLAPATWQTSTGVVELLSASIETHSVMNREGVVQPQPCFVLRASAAPGSRFRLRTEGIAFEGSDEQCFVELGHYSLRQWPVSLEAVERSLQSVHLISVDQFQSEVERSGGLAIFAASESAGDRLDVTVPNALTIRSMK